MGVWGILFLGTTAWAILGSFLWFILPTLGSLRAHRNTVQTCTLTAILCLWLFWAVIYMSQMHMTTFISPNVPVWMKEHHDE